MTIESQPNPSWQGTGPNRGRVENPLASHAERARELGLELEQPRDKPVSFDEIGVPNQPNVITPPIKYAPAPAPLTLAQQFDQQVSDAEALVVRRDAERVAAAARLTQAEQARIAAPDEPQTLAELETAERLDRVATLDAKAAHASRDQVVARVAEIKKSGKLAQLETLDSQQSDAGALGFVSAIEAKARALGTGLGEIAVEVPQLCSKLLAARRDAERLARELGLRGYRPGRVDQGFVVRKVGAAFAAGFTAASKLPVFAIARWTGQ